MKIGDIVEKLDGTDAYYNQEWKKVKLIKLCRNGTWVVRPEFG